MQHDTHVQFSIIITLVARRNFYGVLFAITLTFLHYFIISSPNNQNLLNAVLYKGIYVVMNGNSVSLQP